MDEAPNSNGDENQLILDRCFVLKHNDTTSESKEWYGP
uniref:Uncharacterized protein n=1 Tax=Arundo donax TaxID=35708 RepID=A0A0A9FNR1_ARUDO